MADKDKEKSSRKTKKRREPLMGKSMPEPMVVVQNPRYEGATPEDVALALLRPKGRAKDD